MGKNAEPCMKTINGLLRIKAKTVENQEEQKKVPKKNPKK
jgi:hypothetical protein